MTPETRNVLLKELMGDEGVRLHVYDDATGKPIGPGSAVVGNPTIAIGRNLVTRGVTASEAEYLCTNDMNAAEAELLPSAQWVGTLSANRQAAIYSLYFNTSLGNPKRFLGSAGWPNFLAQCKAGQFEAAADNLLAAKKWVSEVGVGRAMRLSNFIRNG